MNNNLFINKLLLVVRGGVGSEMDIKESTQRLRGIILVRDSSEEHYPFSCCTLSMIFGSEYTPILLFKIR